MKKQLYTLLGAKTFSDFGFAFDFICFSLFIWTHTQSAWATGCLSAAFYSGGILGGKAAHQWGDRWDRRKAMMGADLLRSFALICLLGLPLEQQLVFIYPVIFLIGVGRAVFESSLAASLPAMAGDKLQWVNSLISGMKSTALVLGMLFAAIAIEILGYRFLFFLDALTYALSALVLLRVCLPFHETTTVEREKGMGVSAKKIPLLKHLGLIILLLIFVRVLDAFGSGTHHIGLPMLGTMLNAKNPGSIMG
ncbi:MAG: MFS transporter, partial [Deltaproteobacteria bacterium]|nr:MFS transporter [Deltaproteobacteria bacterium]